MEQEMKIQVYLPERAGGTKPSRMIEVRVFQTEQGPMIEFKNLLGETIESFLITKLLDCGSDLEDLVNHECPEDDCDKSHCDDGECIPTMKRNVQDKIDELKHTFHQLENLLDP